MKGGDTYQKKNAMDFIAPIYNQETTATNYFNQVEALVGALYVYYLITNENPLIVAPEQKPKLTLEMAITIFMWEHGEKHGISTIFIPPEKDDPENYLKGLGKLLS